MPKNKKSVLFICVHNSARSQIGEELLKKYGGDKFSVESAGLDPGELNPYVVKALFNDEQIDISNKKTQAVMDLWKSGKRYHSVITVCSAAEQEGCPVFPGVTNRLHWLFDDPSTFRGSEDEILSLVVKLKNDIKKKIMQFIEENA